MKTKPHFTLSSFKPEHAYRTLEYLVEAKYTVSPRDQWDKFIRTWQTGKAFTMMADKVIVGCGGIVVRNGIGEAWIIATPLIFKYRKTVYKLIRNMLDIITREYKLRRVEAVCPCEFPGAIKLLEHLGFVNETPNGMRQYGPGGETFYLFGRTQ